MGKRNKGNIVIISAAHLLHDVYSSFLAPMLPFLIGKYGLTLYLAGFLDVARQLPSLFNPLAGIIADKTHLRYFLIVTPGVTACIMSMLGLAPGYGFLLILLFAAGISAMFFHIPAPVMIKRFSGERTGAGMSLYMFGGELARTLGPLLITGAISWWGLEGSYKVMPLGLAVSVILYFKLRGIKECDRCVTDEKKSGLKTFVRRYSSFLFVIAGFTLFRAGMKAALTLYLPTYLSGQGNSMWFAAISLAVLQFTGAVGAVAAGVISDKIGKANMLLIVAVANPLLMWAFISSSGKAVIPVLVAVGFLLFAPGPVLLALVQDTDSGRPSFINSIYMTINFLISSITVLLVGLVGDHIGLEMTFKIFAGVAVLSIPFAGLLKKRTAVFSTFNPL